jgi:hypothetical protein
MQIKIKPNLSSRNLTEDELQFLQGREVGAGGGGNT